MRAMELSKSKVPPSHDWRTSDANEIARRRLRAQTEPGRITTLDPSQRIFSNFGSTDLELASMSRPPCFSWKLVSPGCLAALMTYATGSPTASERAYVQR